ncbi:MAG: OmpH family outer membrane protein [Flavobacteriales bacterium]
MSKNITILLILWNVVLTGLLGWSLLRVPSTASNVAGTAAETLEPDASMMVTARDSGVLKEARIAYFIMDSVQKNFAMVKEQGDRLRGEGQRLQNNLEKEMSKAQQRYEQLMTKDHTYSTKADIQKDELELQGLGAKIQELQARSEQQLARMEMESLSRISEVIEGFLTDYNAKAGFDYIFSVQSGGQIWTGNDELDITAEVVNGLNSLHRSNTNPPKN